MVWQDAHAVGQGAPGATRWQDAPAVQPEPAARPAPSAAPPAPLDGQDSTLGFITGNLNKGLAGLAGMPFDTARNAANLGIAGGGMLAHLFGRPAGDLPQPIPTGPTAARPYGFGGSETFDQLLRRGGMIGRSADPTSKGGEYAAAAIQALPSAVMGRPTSLPQAFRAGTAAATSGLGAQAGEDVLGPGGGVVGSMVPGARSMQERPKGVRATEARQADAFGKARDMGIPVPPRAMKADKPQQSLQNEINRELGQPEGAPIDPKTLKAYSAQHFEDGYKPLLTAKELKDGIKPNEKFRTAINEIGQETREGLKQHPETFKTEQGVMKLLGDYAAGTPMQAKAAVNAIRKLRSDATTNLTADDPSKVALGRAQRKIAMSLETLIEDNLAGTGNKALLDNFRSSRTAIAKAHDVESSLDPVTRKVSGEKMSALQTEGRPLSGRLSNIAEVSGEFPGALKTPQEGEMFSKRMSPYGVVHPGALAAHAVTRWHDPLTMSGPYQSLLVDPRARLTPMQERLLRLFAGNQSQNLQDIPPAP